MGSHCCCLWCYFVSTTAVREWSCRCRIAFTGRTLSWYFIRLSHDDWEEQMVCIWNYLLHRVRFHVLGIDFDLQFAWLSVDSIISPYQRGVHARPVKFSMMPFWSLIILSILMEWSTITVQTWITGFLRMLRPFRPGRIGEAIHFSSNRSYFQSKTFASVRNVTIVFIFHLTLDQSIGSIDGWDIGSSIRCTKWQWIILSWHPGFHIDRQSALSMAAKFDDCQFNIGSGHTDQHVELTSLWPIRQATACVCSSMDSRLWQHQTRLICLGFRTVSQDTSHWETSDHWVLLLGLRSVETERFRTAPVYFLEWSMSIDSMLASWMAKRSAC